MFLHFLNLTTKIKGVFLEDTLNHYLSLIIRDDVLGRFVGEGFGRTKDGIGDGLGNFSGHDDVSLTGFFMEG